MDSRAGASAAIRLRALGSYERKLIDLVASRMIDTLVEVLGPDKAHSLHTLEDAVGRVEEHLDPKRLTGCVLVAEVDDSSLAGHSLLRLHDDGFGAEIGLFGTIHVAPEFRRLGVASNLIKHGERWFREKDQVRAVTYTDKDNRPLHELFFAHGYTLAPMPRHFVALQKTLTDTT